MYAEWNVVELLFVVPTMTNIWKILLSSCGLSICLSVCLWQCSAKFPPLGFYTYKRYMVYDVITVGYLPIKGTSQRALFICWKAWVAKCNATTIDSLTHSTHPRENVVTHETGQRSASEFGLCSSYLWRFAKSIFEKEHPSKTLRDNFIGQGIGKHQSDLLYWWNQQKESGEMSDILCNGINTSTTLQNLLTWQKNAMGGLSYCTCRMSKALKKGNNTRSVEGDVTMFGVS